MLARCVLIEGIGGLPTSGPREPLSTAIFMMTVPAAVICGVTLSVSAASLKFTVVVLFATV